MIVKTKLDELRFFYNLEWRDILYVEQDADYQLVVTKNGPIRVHGTMDEMCDKFPQLMRAHRSWLINVHEMLGYSSKNEDHPVTIMFKDKSILKIGRSRTFFDDFVREFFDVANGVETFKSHLYGNRI